MRNILFKIIFVILILTVNGIGGASQICLDKFNPDTQRDIEDGLHERFHANGILENAQHWKNGCMISSKHYDEGGRIKSQSVWDEKGKLTMEEWSYFENGDLAMEYLYSESTGEGFRRQLHINGQPSKEVEIKRGKVVKYVEYDEEGKMVVEEDDPKKLIKILDASE